ncbi:MAG: hypothetical protein ACO1TE_17725 [Prosthecobacter sp.]
MSTPTPLQQLEFDLSQLAADFPPVWRHPHKQAIHDRVRREGGPLAGMLHYSRWKMAPLADEMPLHACDVRAETGFFTYAGSSPGVWHLNFADPRLFAAYGSPLMAQDEWQALEHPVLGSLREALIHDEQPALTREDGVSTPVLVANVPRQCSIDLSGGAAASSWLRGLFGTAKSTPLYGSAFASADCEHVMRAITIINPPSSSNILAIAAPTGTGPYSLKQITDILQTAFNGFAAAAHHSTQHHDTGATAVTIHTGWWGCGAFGGSRPLMALLQILAAKMAGIGRLVFHIGSEGERCHFNEALSFLDLVTSQGTTPRIPAILSEIDSLRFHWGQSDGN